MNVSTLARLAFKHTYNHFAEELYLHTGKDVTRPVTFYGLVNERCNVKCRYCEYWRLPKYKDEMSIEEWQNALLSIKEFVGTFSISFSGGEPFIKPGFLDLMTFCHKNGIHAGVTTNGSALNQKNAAKLADAEPLEPQRLGRRPQRRAARLPPRLAGAVRQAERRGSSTSARSATSAGSTSRSSSSRRSARRTSATCPTWSSGPRTWAPRPSTSSPWTAGPRRPMTSSGSRRTSTPSSRRSSTR